jgi:NTP pyrophosphatase (non-canonical NTP hydrolase)
MELGFAQAYGLRIFGRHALAEPAFRDVVEVVNSPEKALAAVDPAAAPAPARPLSALQDYYRRVALARGYDREEARDCMLLLTEEMGELAHAVRKRLQLIRHDGYAEETAVSNEIADVQLYLVHLANVLGVDLALAVADKERRNAERFQASQRLRAA